MSRWPTEETLRVVKTIEERATVADHQYRKRALCNPDKAIQEVTGKIPPRGNRLEIIECAAWFDQFHTVPKLTPRERAELDLDIVAEKLFAKNR